MRLKEQGSARLEHLARTSKTVGQKLSRPRLPLVGFVVGTKHIAHTAPKCLKCRSLDSGCCSRPAAGIEEPAAAGIVEVADTESIGFDWFADPA